MSGAAFAITRWRWLPVSWFLFTALAMLTAHAPLYGNFYMVALPIREAISFGRFAEHQLQTNTSPCRLFKPCVFGAWGPSPSACKERYNKDSAGHIFGCRVFLIGKGCARQVVPKPGSLPTLGGGTTRRTLDCSSKEDSSQRSEKLQHFSARYDPCGLGDPVSCCLFHFSFYCAVCVLIVINGRILAAHSFVT